MPDHDLFDLDDAFSSLERDIATISSPRGAGQAIASARRRRRTTYAAVAAVAVLAVGGAAIGQGLGGHDGAVGPSDQPPPPPTALSAEALSAATAGWVDRWGTPEKTQTSSLGSATCLANHSDALNQAIRGGEHVYGAGSTQITYIVGMEFPADRIDAAVAAVTTKASSCKPTVTSTMTYTDGSQVAFYQLPATSGSGDIELWTAQYGDRLALAVMAGTTNEPPADVVGQVDDLLLGALQVDSTFTTGSSVGVPSVSKTASSADFGTVAEPDFAAALAAWPNGWQQNGTKSTGKSLPCSGDWTLGSSSAMGASLGGNGEQDFYNFDSVQNAQASLQALAANLQSCAASPASINTVAGTGAVPVTVAVGSGNEGRVTWIVQHGTTVGYITIPGTTDPPNPVSQAVGGLLDDALAQLGKGPAPVESSAPAPTQQDNGTSSSSGTASASAVPKG